MRRASTVSRTSIEAVGKAIAGAEDRQRPIPGFDQAAYSKASVLCVGAGGIISHVAPTLVRKGIGRLKVLDRDIVEASNLNRQRFYQKDIGQNKAAALVDNLVRECTAATVLVGYAATIEQAVETGLDLSCDVAVCGVDNNPGRVAASRFFRFQGIPVVFLAVSADADHGYVFVQEKHGPCIGCMFPDMINDDRYPCPGTPAIADILETLGGLAVYAVDTLLMERPRNWNYRRISLGDGAQDGAAVISDRASCRMFAA
jgi:molybdopterin/thiamine biosynthesis adenylyltransferase